MGPVRTWNEPSPPPSGPDIGATPSLGGGGRNVSGAPRRATRSGGERRDAAALCGSTQRRPSWAGEMAPAMAHASGPFSAPLRLLGGNAGRFGGTTAAAATSEARRGCLRGRSRPLAANGLSVPAGRRSLSVRGGETRATARAPLRAIRTTHARHLRAIHSSDGILMRVPRWRNGEATCTTPTRGGARAAEHHSSVTSRVITERRVLTIFPDQRAFEGFVVVEPRSAEGLLASWFSPGSPVMA